MLVSLVAPILARAQGMDLAALAATHLFAPLGIGEFGWARDRKGNTLAYSGLWLRAQDIYNQMDREEE